VVRETETTSGEDADIFNCEAKIVKQKIVNFSKQQFFRTAHTENSIHPKSFNLFG